MSQEQERRPHSSSRARVRLTPCSGQLHALNGLSLRWRVTHRRASRRSGPQFFSAHQGDDLGDVGRSGARAALWSLSFRGITNAKASRPCARAVRSFRMLESDREKRRGLRNLTRAPVLRGVLSRSRQSGISTSFRTGSIDVWGDGVRL